MVCSILSSAVLTNCPDHIPALPNQINKKDIELLEDAIKKNMAKKI